MKAPLSYSDFLLLCREHLAAADIEIIKRVSLPPEDRKDSSQTLKEWKKIDITLRNELAKSRAHKYGRDLLQYVRGEGYQDPFVSHFAQYITSYASPLEAELSLDRLRWEKIEELKKGHYFDIDYLITYALQLQILERWDNINSSGGMEVLQGLLEK